MPGAHTYIYRTVQLNLIIFTLYPWPRIMDSAGKRNSQMDPAHGPPLQARVAAANGTVSQLANMLLVVVKQTTPDEPGAHGLNRWGKQEKLNGGELMRAVGMAGKG